MLKTSPLNAFCKQNPQYKENQLRWMIRNGHRNGMFERKAAVKKNNRIQIVEPNFWEWMADGDEG